MKKEKKERLEEMFFLLVSCFMIAGIVMIVLGGIWRN